MRTEFCHSNEDEMAPRPQVLIDPLFGPHPLPSILREAKPTCGGMA